MWKLIQGKGNRSIFRRATVISFGLLALLIAAWLVIDLHQPLPQRPGWKSYRNPRGRYEIMYPDESFLEIAASIDPITGEIVYGDHVGIDLSAEFEDGCRVDIDSTYGEQKRLAITDGFDLSSFARYQSEFKSALEWEAVTLGNDIGYRAVFESRPADAQCAHTVLFAAHKNRLFLVRYPPAHPVATAIVTSLRFK